MSLIHDIYQVLRNECTGSDENKALFDRELGDLVRSSTFQPNLSELDVWKRVWNKPFFQQTDAGVANLECQRRRLVFEDLDLIRGQDWEYTGAIGGKHSAYTAKGTAVNSALDGGYIHTTGGPHVLQHPLRGSRLFANRQLALNFNSIYQAYDSYNQLYVRAQKSSAPVLTPQALRAQLRLQAVPVVEAIERVDGFAYTTACHIATDLGFPFYKPDRWVCKFVLALPHVSAEFAQKSNCTVAQLRNDTLKPDSKQSRERIFKELDILLDKFVQPLPHLGKDIAHLNVAFQRLRTADWIVAHFGIGPESAYGLTATPYDLLKKPGTPLAKKYPDLANLAQTMAAFASPPPPKGKGAAPAAPAVAGGLSGTTP